MRKETDPQGEGCREVLDEGAENALLDYQEGTITTSNGKYMCRYCGMLFETLEEHHEHHRKVHGQTATYQGTAMPT